MNTIKLNRNRNNNNTIIIIIIIITITITILLLLLLLIIIITVKLSIYGLLDSFYHLSHCAYCWLVYRCRAVAYCLLYKTILSYQVARSGGNEPCHSYKF